MRSTGSICCLILAVGCGRFGFDATDPNPDPDAGLPPGVFTPPMLVADLSSDFADADPALTDDQLLVYFNSLRPGGMGEADLWFSERSSVDAAWSTPVNATELNGPDVDETAHLSGDGLTIYFASRRTGVNNVSILVATRTSRSVPFDPPTLLTDAIDTGAGEFSPALPPDEATLYYATDNFMGEAGPLTIRTVRTGNTWGTPAIVEELRPGGAPAVFRNGNGIVIARRAATDEPAHLFEYGRTSDQEPFELVRQLTELEGGGGEVGSWLSASGDTIYFDRTEPGGERNIFVSHRVP